MITGAIAQSDHALLRDSGTAFFTSAFFSHRMFQHCIGRIRQQPSGVKSRAIPVLPSTKNETFIVAHP